MTALTPPGGQRFNPFAYPAAEIRKALAAAVPFVVGWLLTVQGSGDFATGADVVIAGVLSVVAVFVVDNHPNMPQAKAFAAFLTPLATYLGHGVLTGVWTEVETIAGAFVSMVTVWLVPNGDVYEV